jgi:hypothetical protein
MAAFQRKSLNIAADLKVKPWVFRVYIIENQRIECIFSEQPL